MSDHEPLAWIRKQGNPQPTQSAYEPLRDHLGYLVQCGSEDCNYGTQECNSCPDAAQEVPHPPTSEVSLMPQPLPQPDASLPQGDITADVSVPDANTPLNANSDCVSEHVSDYSHDDAAMDCLDLDNMEQGLPRAWRASHRACTDRLTAYIERLEAENDELQSEVDAALENMGNYRADRDRQKAKAEKLVELVVRVLATCPLDYYGTPAKDADDTPYCEAGRCENEYAKCWLKWSAEEATR